MTRLQRWVRHTESLLIAVALAFLVAYAVPIIWPGVPAGLIAVCSVVVIATWVIFAGDYVVRLVLAEQRWRFVRTNLLDLLVIVLPLLRPLRLLRLVALLSVLNRSAASSLRGRVVAYASGGAVLLLFCAGLAITEQERSLPGSNISNFGDGLWWAITTMTTVGYGDRYPVSTGGRLIAAALMVGGIALLGVVTATLASWMVARVAEANDADQAATRSQIVELAAQLEAMRAEMRLLHGATPKIDDPISRIPGPRNPYADSLDLEGNRPQ
jgi:voltage-gated potassium channel